MSTLVLQLRPETEAADDEFAAFLDRGGLAADRVTRIRLDQTPLPRDFDLSPFRAVIVGGGPGCVSDPPEKKSPLEARMEADVLRLMPAILARDMPFLGCCYGMGILGKVLGGRVGQGRFGEPVGAAACRVTEDGRADPLLKGVPDSFTALVGHKEAVEALPPGAHHLVAGEICPFQMIRAGRHVYATQFHPESGPENFALRIRLYRHHGYFPPDEAESLTRAVAGVDASASHRILANFVDLFCR
ncbi:MAG: glutamine amidotransferase [Alphaproteobacteria bacterium]|nr:MAG: glutamine amidotransferase [Alphaproteobacteria bacterium]